MNARELPVYAQREKILAALAGNQVIVVESPTGSGKTTQLPIILHEAGFSATGMIGVTQPRRIATLSVSEFIAAELGTNVPGVVGYKMRFEDLTDASTRIKIMTDGILLQELKADPNLTSYATLIVDEAHERSLNIDFTLGLLKTIIKDRPEFRIIISSATMNAEKFSEYFDECPIIRIDTKIYPVAVEYLKKPVDMSPDDLVYEITKIVAQHVSGGKPGDILIFLPGEYLIRQTVDGLRYSDVGTALWVLPLYGRLSKEEQEQVFIPTPPNKTKVVVSTNIAETSVTIDGVTLVIDSGLGKLNYYNPRTFTSSLVESPVSKASCNQRKGRAGRTQPGTCYRLFTRADYENRPLYTTEEIFRTDLSEVVLRMAELGVSEFERFDFISPPGTEGIISAVETLLLLDALDDDRSLSSIGTMMARFPLIPRLSRMIVEAVNRFPDVIEETVIATAFLSAKSPFLLPHGEEVEARKAHHRFRHDYGDFVSYIILFNAYIKAKDKEAFCLRSFLDPKTMAEVANVKRQIEEIVSEIGVPVSSGGQVEDYLKAVARGLIQFVCVRSSGHSYRSLTAGRIQIHPGSVMFRESPRYIVAGEIVKTSKMFARSVSPLTRSILVSVSKDLADRLVPSGDKRSSRTGDMDGQKKDTTWSIGFGGEIFELKPYKGKKKIALFPWERLKSAVQRGGPESGKRYGKLRGKITYKGLEILSGERVSRILTAVPHIDPEKNLGDAWPRGKDFDAESAALSDGVTNLLMLCQGSKKKRNRLGFLTLCTDGHGKYWFICGRGFTASLEESLASLEALVDDLPEGAESAESVNEAYRRLSVIYEL